MTTKTESGKTETGNAGKLEISKETLRDLTEREPSSADVKGGALKAGMSRYTCDLGCE